MRLMSNLLLGFTVLFASITAQAKEQVTWVLERFEPYYILDGEFRGQGAADRLVALLQQALPEYEHKMEFMPILRIRSALKSGHHVVCISFLKDITLDDFAQYSGVTMLVPPLELTMRRELWESELQSGAQLSLQNLLQQEIKLGVAEGRHYGKGLDGVLYQNGKQTNSAYSRVGEHYMGLANMVLMHRIDVTIGYRAELTYAQKLHPKFDALVSVPATESQEFLYAYAVMPKGEWGDSFKVRINAALNKLRDTPQYRAAMTDWFGDTPTWQRLYQEKVLTGAMDAL